MLFPAIRLAHQYLPKLSPVSNRLYVFSILCWLVGVAPLYAQLSGLSYSLSPTYERVFWDQNASLDDASLYGGQLGLAFGQLIELKGIYAFGNNLSTDFSEFKAGRGISREQLSRIPSRSLDLQTIGVALQGNLGRHTLTPHLLLGAGTLQFAPDGLDKSETIYWQAGAGFSYRLDDWLTVFGEVKNLSYKYNPANSLLSASDLAQASLTPSDFSLVAVNNWSLTLGLKAYVGGRSPDEMSELDRDLQEQLAGGLGNLSYRFVPFYGWIEFHPDLPHKRRQPLAGVELGVGFGPYVGIRAFYWRGLERDDLSKLDKIQFMGGDLNLKLNTGDGLVPFITLGGGFIDIMSGYSSSSPVKDGPFVLAGGGINFGLSRSIRLEAAAKSILVQKEGIAQLEPSSILGSAMFSVGVQFTFGGRQRTTPRPKPVSVEPAREESPQKSAVEKLLREAEALDDSLSVQLHDAAMAGDSATATKLMPQRERARQHVALLRETERALSPSPEEVEQRTRKEPAPETTPRSAVSDKLVTFPIPEEGEIYIRYGKPGSVTIETVPSEEIMRDDRTAGAKAAPGSGASDFRELENRLIERLTRSIEGATRENSRKMESIERRLDMIDRQLAQRPSDMEISIQPGQPVSQPVAQTLVSVDRPSRRNFEGIGLSTGIHTGQKPAQFVVGLQGDYGSILGGHVRLYPEFSMGFGGSTTSFLLSFNTRGFIRHRMFDDVVPYLGGGLGLLAFTDVPDDFNGIQATLNLLIGAELAYGPGILFLEYLNANFFDINRVRTGYRYRW